MNLMHLSSWLLAGAGIACATIVTAAPAVSDRPEILTPPPPLTPRINGATLFGVRPGAPFLYTIPATGERPITFAVDNLPSGLVLDAATGRITGTLAEPGTFPVVFRATNARGTDRKNFRIVVGDRIALTPPLGWNSWNCWAGAVDQDKVLRSARALVSSGLVNHGWTYVNIDDTWQGERGGPYHAILGNEKFPDMKALCDTLHSLGLKAGIYSTPWVTSYAGFRGGSADDASGSWKKIEGVDAYKINYRFGKFGFESEDAKQWAAWGFDYLKYDWYPNDIAHTKAMALALKASGRDIVFSLSNAAPIAQAAELATWANSWRTTGDIVDAWEPSSAQWWQYSVSEIGFNQDAWTHYAGPGHWNDPDMLVLGWVGWGPQLHATRLTPAEQYTHFTLWAMLSAPLLIGCDLERLDAFTLGLLSNDEVLSVNQDALGQPAQRIATIGAIDVFRKPLEDGSVALGFFNRGDVTHTIPLNFQHLGLHGRQLFRDLWRQKDIGVFEKMGSVTVEPHNVVLYKASAASEKP